MWWNLAYMCIIIKYRSSSNLATFGPYLTEIEPFFCFIEFPLYLYTTLTCHIYKVKQHILWSVLGWVSQLGIQIDSVLFLAHLSTKCSRWAFVTPSCPSSVVRRPCVRASVRPSSTFHSNNFFSKTPWSNLMKLGRNVPWVTLFQVCSNGSGSLHIGATKGKIGKF